MKYIFSIISLFFFWFSAISQTTYVIEKDYIRLTDEASDYYEKALPTSFDLSGSSFFPPLYKQTHWVCNQVAASYYMMTFETNKMKNISSASSENQFSIYFPWNYGNGGNGWYGDNYVISMEMMKKLGVPKMSDSQADLIRDSSMWLSGYEEYYKAMHNRVKNYYKIYTKTKSDLTNLKSWIFDNFGSEYYGGTATFLANIEVGGATHFAPGTPHAGAYVITKCGDDAQHARTIVGYDDNVCFDYNGDGLYTNNIDLNNDGLIDVRDYEKGGLKLAEGNGPDWQGDGFCWIMYKCMADAYPNGGILNNYVHIIQPTINYTPLLTARIKIKHTCRERIKLKIGITSNPEAQTWEYITDFPIINYQGGNKYMQGGNTEAEKTIEIGLDITPLLSYFSTEKQAKIFIVINESDDNNNYDGEITEFEILDYSGTEVTGYLHNTTTEIINNSQTVANIIVNVSELNAPKILTQNIPLLSANSPIWYGIQYQGGTAPYKWELLPYFEKTNSTRQFDKFNGTKLTPNEDFDDAVVLDLPFDFPFGNNKTNKIKIHSDGYILPFATTSVWTQFKFNLQALFINEKIIAPLSRNVLTNHFESGDGIWYKYAQDTVKIRWQCSDQWSEPWTKVEFGCNLISDGTIEFVYGYTALGNIYSNISGLSYGHQSDNIIAWLDNIPPANSLITIKPYPIPKGLSINQAGYLCDSVGSLSHYPIRVRLTDNNGISHTAKYDITTNINDIDFTDTKIKIYPNPTDDIIFIELNETNFKQAFVSVYNTYGQLIISNEITNSEINTFNTSNVTSGIYFIKINIDGKRTIKKLVKN
ncbi:MAG: T9SS type A sorting domain-containing protein [Bacteroidales bacterium]|nr:T9SS type A sorting domain-containing protein [Bacteroidales bacterium]